MESENNDMARVLEVLEEMRGSMAKLEERVESLETVTSSGRKGAMSGARRMPGGDDVDLETVMAISAAVAAFLGKEAPIRSVRLLDASRSWAQQGRATIQAWYSVSTHPSPRSPR